MRSRAANALLLLTLITASLPAYAADPIGAIKREVVRDLGDARSIATEPTRWDHRRWIRFAEGAALVAVVSLADRRTSEIVQANRNDATDRFADFVTPFGGGRATQVSALLILAGAASGHHNLRDAGRDALESEVFAVGVLTPLLKRTIGRARPFQALGASSLHPFDNRYDSFPSGHATNAFAFATAVAGHYDGWAVPTLMYTLATSVAAARVNDNVHFVSDVVAGALIGRAMAKGVLARHHTRANLAWQAVPLAERGRYGVVVHIELR
ncbi:MAG TPA: phosphatase PAP2 family protein [Thermoanaerobaculia bacterium]|nr:phosphatase PAP2 family protein [Thermoanaerobaculia bacterium]